MSCQHSNSSLRERVDKCSAGTKQAIVLIIAKRELLASFLTSLGLHPNRYLRELVLASRPMKSTPDVLLPGINCPGITDHGSRDYYLEEG